MQVDVFSTVGEVRSEDITQKTVIVIDVLRATSTIVTALANGCVAIHPMETVGQARSVANENDLLGGERFCKKIQGFDLSNSPHEYSPAVVSNRRIIFTTTNGTRAIHKSLRGETILAGSFLNGKACAERALQLKRDIVIVCAGTKDRFALEDGLCAGYIIHWICNHSGPLTKIGDLGVAMLHAYTNVQDHLTETLLQCESGKRLTKIGYQDDVVYCSKVDLYANVPVLCGHDPLELQND